MSSSTYTLKIDIDDSKIREIEKRLMNIVGGKQGGGGLGATITKASSGGDMGKNIAKLGMIAVGVAGILMAVKKIAELTVQSSPMFMQMLKLINFGVMLLLRPIGDFFGFFLRPLIIYFLRSIILPWYRIARPIMQKFGQWLGKAATGNLSSNISGAFALITGDWDAVARLTKEGNAKMQKGWDDALTSMATWIDSLNLPSFDIFNTGILTWISEQVLKLPRFWIFITMGVRRWINANVPKLPTWEAITIGFNKWVEDNLSFLPSWETIGSAVSAIQQGLLGIIDSIRLFFIELAAKIGIDLTGILGGNRNPTTTTSAPVVTESQTTSDIYPWLTETPDAGLSNRLKGRR